MKKRNTLLYKYISLILFLEKGPQLVVVWEIDRETYTQREDFFFPDLLPGAREYQRLHPLASSSEMTWSAACPTLDFNSLPLSKSDHKVLITWSPSGYTLVVLDCPDCAVISLFTHHILYNIWRWTWCHCCSYFECYKYLLYTFIPKLHVWYTCECNNWLHTCCTRLSWSRCHIPVYSLQRDSLSKHTGSLGVNRKSTAYII